jgi:hypothetical protein
MNDEFVEPACRLGYRDIQYHDGRYIFKVGGRALSCDQALLESILFDAEAYQRVLHLTERCGRERH